MKKFKCALAAILMCLTACLCGACSTEEEQQPANATQNTQTFVTLVSQIPNEVTLDYGLKIEAALLVYNYLNETEKTNADVASSKTRLDGLKAEYDEVKAVADEQAAIAKENKLVSDFVAAVEGLPSLNKLKIEDGETVDGLIEKYGQLKAESKEKSEVTAAYAKLQEAASKIDVLKEEARREEIKAAAENFIAGVEEIEEVTLETGDVIENLLYDYEDFDEDVKAYEGVAEAKEKLDGFNAEYTVLRDEADVEEFLELVEALTPVEEKVTIESESAITKAESAYRYMSETAKVADGVAEANAVLAQARAKYDELFAAAEAIRVQAFIEAANNVRTDIENVDIMWYDELEAASKAYDALSYASRDSADVKEAYTRWNAAQKVFNGKGYQKIPMYDPTIVYSGDVPPHLVLQNHANMLNPVVEFYKLSSYTEISQHATLWLNVYIDGEYIGRGALDTAKFLDSGHIIPGSEVVNVLKALAADHSEVKSGVAYGFSLNFEDKENAYIPSVKTKISANKVYTW